MVFEELIGLALCWVQIACVAPSPDSSALWEDGMGDKGGGGGEYRSRHVPWKTDETGSAWEASSDWTHKGEGVKRGWMRSFKCKNGSIQSYGYLHTTSVISGTRKHGTICLQQCTLKGEV